MTNFDLKFTLRDSLRLLFHTRFEIVNDCFCFQSTNIQSSMKNEFKCSKQIQILLNFTSKTISLTIQFSFPPLCICFCLSNFMRKRRTQISLGNIALFLFSVLVQGFQSSRAFFMVGNSFFSSNNILFNLCY